MGRRSRPRPDLGNQRPGRSKPRPIYEGVPRYYTKETATVHGTDGDTYTGLIYIMNKDMQRMSMPDKSYVDGIQSAYRALGFAAELRNLQAAVTRMANRCRYIAPDSRPMFLDKTYQ